MVINFVVKTHFIQATKKRTKQNLVYTNTTSITKTFTYYALSTFTITTFTITTFTITTFTTTTFTILTFTTTTFTITTFTWSSNFLSF